MFHKCHADETAAPLAATLVRAWPSRDRGRLAILIGSVTDRRTFVATLAGSLLATSFSAARAPNTPAQDRALVAWNACTTGPTTACLDQIEAKGRIHFHYSGPS